MSVYLSHALLFGLTTFFRSEAVLSPDNSQSLSLHAATPQSPDLCSDQKMKMEIRCVYNMSVVRFMERRFGSNTSFMYLRWRAPSTDVFWAEPRAAGTSRTCYKDTELCKSLCIFNPQKDRVGANKPVALCSVENGGGRGKIRTKQDTAHQNVTGWQW